MDQQEQSQPKKTRCLPIKRTETSLIKDEFDSLRARFDAEMRQMEADMARFRSQMERSSLVSSSRTSNCDETSSGGLKRASTTTSSKTTTRKTTTRNNLDMAGHVDDHQPNSWLNEFAQSPIVVCSTGETGNEERSLKLRFDVSDYKPDEILVKTFDDRLQVEAKHEEANEQEFVSREYKREFLLPENVDHDQIRSSLSLEGILTVEVPL